MVCPVVPHSGPSAMMMIHLKGWPFDPLELKRFRGNVGLYLWCQLIVIWQGGIHGEWCQMPWQNASRWHPFPTSFVSGSSPSFMHPRSWLMHDASLKAVLAVQKNLVSEKKDFSLSRTIFSKILMIWLVSKIGLKLELVECRPFLWRGISLALI